MRGNSTPKPLLVFLFAVILSNFFSSCATNLPAPEGCKDFSYDPVSPKISPEILATYPLSYSHTAKDNSGEPFFEITYEYIGRCPEFSMYKSPNPTYPGPNYNDVRVSFYHRSFTNLTDSPVVLKRETVRQLFQNHWTRYRVDKRGNEVAVKVPAITHRDFSDTSSPGGNIIQPHEVQKGGSWCYSTSGEVWLYELIVEYQGEEYTINYHRVGH